jgi:hypothetical protein
MEARVRIELTYKGFADLSLTTWVPRPPGVPAGVPFAGWGGVPDIKVASCGENVHRGGRTIEKFWSGRRDLNPRLRPWQGRTLPLSYSRSIHRL